ncbi:Cellulose synthase-like protein G3 [Linum perenne]
MGTSPLLHQLRPLPHAAFNRLFAAVYASAVLAILYRHVTSFSTTLTHILFLISDLVLAFKWLTAQALRMYPVRREQFPENLEKLVPRDEFPALDVLICTADPYKEPPLRVVNTALSVMAYEYPAEKLSVYVSDDGGSALTLFAFLEAAKFAAYWLPFCRENDVVDRSPEVYFASSYCSSPDTITTLIMVQIMYEEMKDKIERVMEKGTVDEEYITSDAERHAFNKWTATSAAFSTNHHPSIIQVLLHNKECKDKSGGLLPNLIYVTREKSKTTHHNFKAGALNVLLRVSAVMTNAPLILTLDCDMFSTNPRTPLHVLCYFFSGDFRPNHAFVQFPQRFRGINSQDIYAGDLKHYISVMPYGLDGLVGPIHMGTCCFFSRRAFFGGPSDSDFVSPEIPELFPGRLVDRPIQDPEVLGLAHRVAGCEYEARTHWGTKMGFRYGTMVEDLYTGFNLHCEGWKSIWCYPESPFFLGDSPINFLGQLIQQTRWVIGLFQITLSKYSPLTYGIRKLGLLMGLGYCHFTCWIIWFVPITTYSFLPQLALLNGVSIFPKASDPWFLLYIFLFLGAYGQDLYEFLTIDNKGTFLRWWNEQRMWIIRGLSCSLFGGFEFFLKSLGISQQMGFSLTSKVVDEEQSKRYDKGMFEFGVASPIFVPMTMAALISLVSFVVGIVGGCRGGWGNVDGLLIQILVSGFGVANSFPIYEAMGFRNDPGKLQMKTGLVAVCLSIVLCSVASVSIF